jgi:putative ABC transport system permease protein
MFLHFLKIAVRSIRKKGLFSVLNILGLSIGIASFLVILLYVFQETSFEKRHENYESTFRIEEHFLSMGRLAWSGSNLHQKLDEIPEIERFSRITFAWGKKATYGENSFKINKLIGADQGFFEVFSFDFIAGNEDEVLSGTGQAVIGEKFAQKIFGTSDVVGYEIEIKDDGKYLIEAVVKEPKLKSHVDFEMVIYRAAETDYANNNWFQIGGYTYVTTVPGTTTAQLNEKLDNISEKYAFPIVYGSDDLSFDEWKEGDNKIRFYARPIKDIYLEADVRFEIGEGGDKQTVVTLIIIGVFILIIASINFMNLTTARSSLRTKEIGVRKVLGSHKKSLVFQFLLEALIITLFSALVGAGMSEGIINVLNQQFGNIIGVSLVTYPELIIYTVIGVILLAVLSGLYPAFYLSSAKVVPLLKGMQLSRVLNLNFAKALRNVLVVTQFTLSIGLIIGSIFIYRQLVYLKNKDLGFDKEQVLVIQNTNDIGENKQAFKNELLNVPGVESAAYTYIVPGDGSTAIKSSTYKEKAISMTNFVVDQDFKNALGLRMKEGVWFEESHMQFDSLVVVNDAFVQQFGLVDPIGEVFGDFHRIIGVVEDFNYGNLRESVGPALIRYSNEYGGRMVIKLNAETVPLMEIEGVWNDISSEPLEYKFLEQNFVALLERDKNTANAILIFTLLAIVISCLGLFGLAAFTADQRMHEFGIRKVLGANVQDIVKIFSFDFIKLVAIAFLIAVPISIWGINMWLQGFADRISLSAGVFAIAGILAISIAFVTILFQSLKTGRLNPVDTIKNE